MLFAMWIYMYSEWTQMHYRLITKSLFDCSAVANPFSRTSSHHMLLIFHSSNWEKNIGILADCALVLYTLSRHKQETMKKNSFAFSSWNETRIIGVCNATNALHRPQTNKRTIDIGIDWPTSSAVVVQTIALCQIVRSLWFVCSSFLVFGNWYPTCK